MIFLLWSIWLIAIILICTISIKKTRRQKAELKKKNPAGQSKSSAVSSYRRRSESPKEDILTRSRRNTEKKTTETAASVPRTVSDTDNKTTDLSTGSLQQLSHDTGSLEFDSSDLMTVVEDLIVKGYEPKLSFERDFIAEGTDLLNHYYYKRKSRNL